jgi:hypothetical protein
MEVCKPLRDYAEYTNNEEMRKSTNLSIKFIERGRKLKKKYV